MEETGRDLSLLKHKVQIESVPAIVIKVAEDIKYRQPTMFSQTCYFFRFSFICFSVVLMASSEVTTAANKRHISVCLSRTSAVMRTGLGPAGPAGGTGPSSVACHGSGSGLVAPSPLWEGDLAAVPLEPGAKRSSEQ